MMEGRDKTKYILYTIGILLFIAISLQYSDIGEAIGDTVTVSVNVSQLTLVDINPSNLSWQNVPPGGIGDSTLEVNNYSSVWIENIGSTNITYVWFNNTYPSSLPFGTGNSNAYDAGNFIVISNGTGSYQYINRVEYYENDSLYVSTNVQPPSYADGDIFGRFRNNSYEYFWEFDDANATAKNCSSGNFYISTTPKTQSSTGDADLTDNTPIPLSNVGGYAVGNVTIGGSETYCVAIPSTCDYVMFHKWNADAPGTGTAYCNMTGYFIDGSSDPLVPGEVGKAKVKVYVPFGVPYGPVADGVLTVIVQQ